MSKKRPTPKSSEIDQAFAAKQTLADLKLQPWTPERIMHAQSLGTVYPNWGESDREQFLRTGVYPGQARDVSIFVYLCTLPKDEVDLATWEDAKTFGIQRGFHRTNSPEFRGASDVFFKAWNEIRLSSTKPKGDKTKTDDELPNE